ncbi:MAG: hypothetical protein B6I20_05070 [Bacteroidetes bacterium 4572_117]|nr:MAG: hypothetical protein B6I20_05070 [Bacteroidetes bacterium 4572_117]
MQIKLKKITLLTFYFLSSYIGTAQSIELKGRIIEKEKHKPLNFATFYDYLTRKKPKRYNQLLCSWI